MTKTIIIAIILSIIAIFFLKEIGQVLLWISEIHRWSSHLLTNVFAGGKIGVYIREVLALFLIPFIIALIPTIIYKLVAHKKFEYFAHVLWGCWLVLLTAIALR